MLVIHCNFIVTVSPGQASHLPIRNTECLPGLTHPGLVGDETPSWQMNEEKLSLSESQCLGENGLKWYTGCLSRGSVG